jgi:RND family efflux transporter MFP subunit
MLKTNTGRSGSKLTSRLAGALLASAAVLTATIPQAALAQGAPPPPSVSVAKPIKKNVTEWTDFIGRFEAVDAVDIRARVSGYVDKISVADGALVKAGDLLFTIDKRTYEAAADQAEADLESAKARQAYAVTDLKRAETLRRNDNISEQIADQRRQGVQTTDADIKRAQAVLDRAKLDLEFTEIRAPVSGRISRRAVSLGTLVNANDTVLVNIVSLDPINFYFDVDERAYLAVLKNLDPRLNPGSEAEVVVTLTDESAGKRTGKIDFIDNRLDSSSGTMRGRAVFENKDLALVPGLFGRVRIPASQPYMAVLIPDEAIRADQDRRLVFVLGDGNKLAPKAVQLGPRTEGYRIVRAGLSGDETIVINGMMRAQPGAQVQPKLVELPIDQQVSSR